MRAHPLYSERRRPRSTAGLDGLILLGLDNVRSLEDLFGEDIGDEVMQAVETRIAHVLRDTDTVRRAGHRRISVAVRGLDDTGVSGIVTRLQAAVAHSAIATSHGPVSVTVAAGCAISRKRDPDVQLAGARHALIEAMSQGVGCIRFFGDTAGAIEIERDHVVCAAQLAMGAIRKGDLLTAFQPVVWAAGGNHAAFHECLVRLRDRQGNLVAANEFMPAIERLGLAPHIDRQMLIMALDTLSRQPGIRLSLNVFPQTMQDAQWMMLFDEGTRNDPSLAERLIIEITETTAMLESARTLAFMERLRHRGVAFALDDFGVGHNTSFGRLRDFRFDIIKIDGSFVTDITTNADSRFFVSKLIEVGRYFEMMIVAEFVQGAADARILRDLGVECFQGFHFGAPGLVLTPELTPQQVTLSSG